jgi:hypothetical protein
LLKPKALSSSQAFTRTLRSPAAPALLSTVSSAIPATTNALLVPAAAAGLPLPDASSITRPPL